MKISYNKYGDVLVTAGSDQKITQEVKDLIRSNKKVLLKGFNNNIDGCHIIASPTIHGKLQGNLGMYREHPFISYNSINSVACAIFCGDMAVLLVNPKNIKNILPSGFINRCESTVDTASRIIKEKTGLVVNTTELSHVGEWNINTKYANLKWIGHTDLFYCKINKFPSSWNIGPTKMERARFIDNMGKTNHMQLVDAEFFDLIPDTEPHIRHVLYHVHTIVSNRKVFRNFKLY